MKFVSSSLLILSILGTSVFGANTELLTKAMVKLINKQKTLENAIIVLKQNQNKQKYELSNNEISPEREKQYLNSNKQIAVLNSQINEIQKELDFAKHISELKIEKQYKYTRNENTILKIDNFISANK
jgi:long-subunit acyl-CoA synthetase (AMP-forming)